MKRFFILAAFAASMTFVSLGARAMPVLSGPAVAGDANLVQVYYPCDPYFHLNRWGRCVSDYGPRAMGYGEAFQGGPYRGHWNWYWRHAYWHRWH